MRYVVGILLLASPALSSEPTYSWQSRADDSDQIYLYLDGNQIGGWCYSRRKGSWSGVSLPCGFCLVKVFRMSGQEAP